MSGKAVINLFVPSSTPDVLLQCRFFVPPGPGLPPCQGKRVTDLAELGEEYKTAVKALGVRKLVTAAHPWGRLGGNQDFP